MLDVRTRFVLKALDAECKDGTYRVVEVKELLENLPKKMGIDSLGLAHCMQYLEKCGYISVKYKDSKVYCVALLPVARQMLESESENRQKTKKMITMGSMLYILVFVFAFLGSFLAIIAYGMIF